MRSLKLVNALALALLLTYGCTSKVPTQVECEEVPCAFKEENDGPVLNVMNWWEIFNDPKLNELMDIALENSPTLDLAISRVLEAQAIYGRTYADLWPNITFDPSDQQTGSLQPFSFGGLGTTRFHQRQYTIPVDLSWEVDLFGRLGYQADSAFNTFQAQKAAYWGVRLALTADIATTYFNLRANIRLKKILEDTLKVRRDALEINESRYQAGLVNYIDVSRAALEVSRALTAYQRSDENILTDTNRLAFLVGEYASDFNIEASPIENDPPALSAGIPSDLLLNRPDIIEAYFNIQAQADTVKARKAALFPTFIVTGTLGLFSPDSSELFSWRARLWEWMMQASQTIYDFGRKIEDIDASKAVFRQNVDEYIETVLQAFEEVENALVLKRLSALELTSIRESIKNADLTRNLARDRYMNGLINYLDVVDAERDLLQAQSDEVNTVYAQYRAVINIAKAIGGKWTEPDIDEECEVSPDQE